MDAKTPPDANPVRRKPELPVLDLRVEAVEDLHPGLRRLIFSCKGGLPPYKPGQDLVFMLPTGDGEFGRRHYTIRNQLPDGRFSVDFVLHGATPGPQFALAAQPGTLVQARGPRGRTSLRTDTHNHLFMGDETGMPAILHMLETLPEGMRASAVIEVPSAEWQHAPRVCGDCKIEWLHRNGRPAPSDLLTRHLDGANPQLGDATAYLLTETGVVRQLRHRLLELGLSKTRIVAEGYWRPGRMGGHDHI
ncbi:siderophore-interacting protein [Paracoccus sp. TK19116]|uniref:Siderophore-interacting protein n=1 Tax=Paracoccus albicereus TaxID=2922394 RepID=A0ABT1MUD5_9RHOB|nr:siderophore-interacting protein [Paracoccus albicereus]MCQ0971953.1 siderophore-interacting protein [Paracoccus albicereus]